MEVKRAQLEGSRVRNRQGVEVVETPGSGVVSCGNRGLGINQTSALFMHRRRGHAQEESLMLAVSVAEAVAINQLSSHTQEITQGEALSLPRVRARLQPEGKPGHTHAGPRRERPVTCEECGRALARSQLSADARGRTQGEARRVQGCGRGFRGKSNLLTHQRTHSWEKPCVCRDCGRLCRDK